MAEQQEQTPQNPLAGRVAAIEAEIEKGATADDPTIKKSLWERYKEGVRHDFATTGDLFKAVPREAINLFNETTNFFNDLATGTAQVLKDSGAAYTMMPGMQGMQGLVELVAEDTDASNIPQVVSEYKTTAGQFIGVATRFGLGFALTGGPKKAVGAAVGSVLGRLPGAASIIAKYPRLASVLGNVSLTTVQGGALDAAIFDPNEETLAELAAHWSNRPEFVETATAWLRSDGDDSRLEKRFKNMLEGMLLGGAIDFGLEAMRGFRFVIKAQEAVKQGASDLADQLLGAADESFEKAAAAVEPRADDVVEAVGNQVVPRGTRPEAADPSLWEVPEQQITSGTTSRNQVAGGFKKMPLEEGTKNIDIGGGKWDKGTEFAAARGVDSQVWDPFARSEDHNARVVASHGNGQSDTATIFNVLNVIQDATNRQKVLRQAADALKDDGKVYIQVYEGKPANRGVPQATRDGWQENRPLAEYLEEVREVFPDAHVERGMIVGTRPPRAPVLATLGNEAEAAAKAHSMNQTARGYGDPKVVVDMSPRPRTVTPEQEVRILAARQQLSSADPSEYDDILAEMAQDINIPRLVSDREQQEWVAAIMKVMGDPLPHRKGVQTNDQTAALAFNLIEGAKEEDIFRALDQFADFGDTMPQRVLGFRLYMAVKVGRAQHIAHQLMNNIDDLALNDALGRAINDVFQVADRVSRGVTGVARTLQQQNMEVWDVLQRKSDYQTLRQQAFDESIMKQKEALDVMSGLSPRQRLALARKIATAKNARQIQRIVVSDRLALRAAREIKNPGRLARAMDAINAYQINGLLSGPRTHAINFLSNAVMAFARPTANLFGGVLHAATHGGDVSMIQRSLDQYTTSWNAIGESWHLAKEAFWTNEVTLDPFRTISEIDEHMVGEGLTNAPGDLRTMTSWSRFKSLFWYPMRGLKAGDELFKQIAYRSEVGTKALAEGRERGLRGERLAEFAHEAVENSRSQWGEALDKQALQVAREQTFQQDSGRFGQLLQRMVDVIPGGVGRWFFPFVRTPLNIFKTSMTYTPGLNLAVKEARDAIFKGSIEQRSEYLGRVMMGTGAMATGYVLYSQGNFTGGGPKDQALRERWMAAGNRPYSLKIGGTWFRYDRLEPLGTVLGLVPDFFDAMAEAEAAGLPMNDTMYAVGFALTNSLKDRAFTRQLVTLLNAAFPRFGRSGDPVQRIRDDLATRAIPMSALSRALAQGTDPVIRETRGMVDKIRAAVPGLSHTVPPKRNVFGEPILRTPNNTEAVLDQAGNFANVLFNPMTISTSVPDDVHEELLSLGKGFQLPSETIPGTDVSLVDIDLRNERGQTPYDRMMEIVGEGNLMNRVTRKIRSASYQNKQGDNPIERGGIRWKILNGIINGAHQRALKQTLDEFPELKDLRRDYYRRLRITRRGGAEALRQHLEEAR